MNNLKNDFNVDAVITWVNGNDKKWQEKINTFSEVKINFSSKQHLKRYNSIGEIDIAIMSIIKFASFVKTIYLVTDNQKPESFNKLKTLAKNKGINLELIDHKIIFREFDQYLPTFNSCSIGSMLFRIPNLSEHFIIFNDDTFIMRKTSKDDFFKGGFPLIRGRWKAFNENRKLRILYHNMLSYFGVTVNKTAIGFKKLQQNSAKLVKTKKYIRRFHTPVCVRKSTLENFFKNNTILNENVKYRFRNENQFIISSLSEHLEIEKSTYHYRKNSQLVYFRSYKTLWLTKLKLALFKINKNKLFITFQSLDMANETTLKTIFNWIDNRLKINV